MSRHQVWRVRELPEPEGPFLLDTHVWFWLLAGDGRRMHRRMPTLLDDAAARGELHVSDISCWEIAFKAERGTLSLGLPVDEWLDRAVATPGITMLPLDRRVLVHGARLNEMHGDPADRWLVATARQRRLTLLTADAAILAFGRRDRLVRMVDVRR